MGLNRANIRQVSFSSPNRVLKSESKINSQDQLCTLLERLLVKLDQNGDTSRTRERRSSSPRRDVCYRCGQPGNFMKCNVSSVSWFDGFSESRSGDTNVLSDAAI